MIFRRKKKLLVWCDDPPEDRVISMFAGLLTNHDCAHNRNEIVTLTLKVLGGWNLEWNCARSSQLNNSVRLDTHTHSLSHTPALV